MLLIKISKWGNGQGIRIPKSVLELLKWQKDDELEMIVEKGNLKIQKVEKEKRKTIKELFANYDGSYEKQEIDWGEPQGKEIW